MATLEELVVRIRADASQLEREMARASAVTQQAGGRMASALEGVKGQFLALVPAISLGAIVAFGKQAIDAAGHLQDLGDRIGFAASTLSALEPGLAASGSSVDDLAASVNLMNNQLGEAAKGGQEAVKAFDTLGLSVRKLQQLSPEEQFYAVVEALAGLESQYEQTEAGRAIFGRGFAALIPLIKESNGNLKEHVAAQKELANALSDETIKRIDDFGDALSNAGIKAKNSFLEAFSAILRVVEQVDAGLTQFGQGGAQGGYAAAKIGPLPQDTAAREYQAKARRLGFATGAVFLGDERYGPDPIQGPNRPKVGARGGNAGLIKGEKEKKAKEAEDYDKAGDALSELLAKQEDELELARLTGKAQAVRRAEIEATAAAIKEGNLPSAEMLETLKATAGATYDAEQALKKLNDAQEEAKRFQGELKDKFSETLSEIVLNFDNAADAAERFAAAIAKMVIEKQITGPLADSLSSAIGGSEIGKGIGDFFGGLFGGARAEGGPVASGMSYLVGEKGPEIFTPSISGAITPNGKMAGGVTVVQHNTFGSGVTRSEVAGMLPGLVTASKNAVFDAIARGGNESRMIGKRS